MVVERCLPQPTIVVILAEADEAVTLPQIAVLAMGVTRFRLAVVALVAAAGALAYAPTSTMHRAATSLHAKKAKKAAKKGARLQEMRDLSAGSAGATKDWAATLTQRLDAAASSAEVSEKEDRLLELCAESNRDLAAIDGVVRELETLPPVAAADAPGLAAGDWKLVWARSDEGVCNIGTGLHKVPLANLEEIFLTLSDRKITTTEVIRVVGPFPNVKNLLFGSAKVSPTKGLALSYSDCIDGTGNKLKGEQARDVAFGVASLSRDVLVLEASGVGDAEWLVFEREPDLAGMLASSRVAPNDDEGSIL